MHLESLGLPVGILAKSTRRQGFGRVGLGEELMLEQGADRHRGPRRELGRVRLI
jgi:hypothetical protein